MSLSRRDFLKSALATAVAAQGLTLFPAGKVFADDTQVFPQASHYGPFNAVVKNGKLIGVQPVTEVDPLPTKMLLEGIISRTFSDTRILYPMVRKSYLADPLGDTKPHLRGKEPFVRVDWNTAIALTSMAIARTINKYGNEAIFSASYDGWSHAGIMRPQTLQGRFFNLIGGQSACAGDYSAGASEVLLPHIVGDLEVYSPQTAWQVIEKNTELMLFVGCDPFKCNRVEFRVADHSMHKHWQDFANKGIRFISINPQQTESDKGLGSEMMHIRPNTDTALFTAMSFHLLDKGLYDKAYLDKYTTGADKYIAYLQGKDDGVPKTPEWASTITGIPAAQIESLAELIVSKKTEICAGWSLQRAQHGEMVHWAIINFAAMAGKIGKPGEGFGLSWHYGNGGMPVSGKKMPVGLSQGRNPVKTRCPVVLISEMLQNPGSTYTRNGETLTFPNVKLVYTAGNNLLSHQQNTNELIQALNDHVETFICQDAWWCASARYADIVLASTTTLERNDLTSGGTYSNNKIYAMRQAIKPMGDAMNDYDIFSSLAFMFNVQEAYTGGKSYMEHLKTAYKNSDATESFDSFWKKGITELATPASADNFVRHGEFYQDPVKNPLHTPSGKIEMYSETIAGFNLPDCPPMPQWLAPTEWLGNASPGQLHVLSPHPWMRLHSQMANADVNKYECVDGRQYVLVNAEDAKERGVKAGDLVEIYNDRGALLAGVKVADNVMRGVIYIHEGAWLQKDSKGRCNSGAINILTSARPSSGLSQGNTANTCLAWMKKCDDPESPNMAYQPPVIEVPKQPFNIDELGLGAAIKAVTGHKAQAQSKGETLFYNSCTLCHAAPTPSDYTYRQWQGITKSMFPRAGLGPDEQAEVLSFLKSHAKQ
ncbi:molybdopterin-dependent oxidoreductase [Shewanella sp. GXUN23E]|uniref:molybdopterin-dependent oxidoreductase n=1 Tax=Shewanella sp. GXUN23E TaxID=3422498 RepID=UPI003D7F078C